MSERVTLILIGGPKEGTITTDSTEFSGKVLCFAIPKIFTAEIARECFEPVNEPNFDVVVYHYRTRVWLKSGALDIYEFEGL